MNKRALDTQVAIISAGWCMPAARGESSSSAVGPVTDLTGAVSLMDGGLSLLSGAEQ